jgi:acetolactate synthase-1/2/3 large subunit
MSDNQVSDILAQAFAAEGVDTLFTLMGDANMYWSASMADNQQVRLIHARHEHCCVAMADAWARATGKVGVASVTCGPGYTQIMTALVMAARGNAPVVVFAGDAPIGASWYIQSIDQAPLALGNWRAFRADPHDRPGARLCARGFLRRPRRKKAGGAERAA